MVCRSTVSERPSTATLSPYRITSPSTATAGSAAGTAAFSHPVDRVRRVGYPCVTCVLGRIVEGPCAPDSCSWPCSPPFRWWSAPCRVPAGQASAAEPVDDPGAVQPGRPGLGRGRAGRDRPPGRRPAPREVQVTVGDRDVTSAFAVRPNGKFEGLVDGLALGANELQAEAGDAGRGGDRHQPPERRADLLRAAPRALPVPGRRGRREVQPAGVVHAALQVHRPDPARPRALRPGEPPGRRGHHDHGRGQDGPVHRASRGRLPGPGPLHDPHPLAAGAGLAAVGSPGAVEPQGADHPRRELRGVVRPRVAAAPGLLRHPRVRAGRDAELRDRPGQGLRRRLHRPRQHRPQLQRPDRGRVADDGQGAARRAVRRDPVHDRHRLLRRLDRPAHHRQRLPRHLPGPGHHLLLPGHPDRGDPVHRLPPDAALLRGPVALGRRRRLDADPDGAGGGPRLPRQRGGGRREPLQVGPQPRERLLGHPGHRAGGREHALRLRDQPRRGALLGARHHDQRARPASRERVERGGAGGRPRVRRHPLRQHRRPVRARSAPAGPDHARPVRRPQRQDRRARRQLRLRRRSGSTATRPRSSAPTAPA